MEVGRLSERSDAGRRLLILSGRLESKVFNFFSHGLSFKVDLIGVMDKPVEDGLSQGRVANSLMPVRDRQLTGDESRADVIAVFKYFQQIMSTLVVKWLKTPIIDDEELCSGQGGEHCSVPTTCSYHRAKSGCSLIGIACRLASEYASFSKGFELLEYTKIIFIPRLLPVV